MSFGVLSVVERSFCNASLNVLESSGFDCKVLDTFDEPNES